MIQQLGVMLCEEREKMGETQKSIAEGLISISELCRVERGEQEIDYFTLQALFERLGKSIDKLELAVSGSEYDSISYRIEIERSIENRDYEMLEKRISQYYKYNDEKRPIHQQYIAAMKAMVCYMKNQDYADCLHLMEQALACTLYNDWMQKVRHGQGLCNQEIRIILVMAYCRWKLGFTAGLAEKLEQLGTYIRYHYTDMEEQVKVYPHCAWLLGQLYLEQNKVEEAYAACRKGRESLIENGSLSPLWEILELEEACLEKMGKQTDLVRCRKYQEAVLFLYEAVGTRPESSMMTAFMKSSFQGEFVITNELIKDIREAKGLSQEHLCESVCSQETLSRLENGKRSPNKKKIYQLLKKMGMERENYYGFIEADDYELYEKVRQYNRNIPKGRCDEAMKLLDEIENGLDMTKTVNKQFIGMERIYERLTKGELSLEQANGQLWELLCLTMPPADLGRLFYRVPFRTEYMICNKIAVNLRDDGKVEEALRIYEELMQCYKRSRVSMRYHAVPGLTLYINYAGFLEVNNDLEKAEMIGKEGMLHCVECCRGDMAGDILANLSLVYEKQGLPDIEEKYLRYGYYLISLYGRENMTDILQSAYQDKFHKEIG
ncbi:MAG: helix-turn-helix transcriptional regulator [Lachnospiraceae bacterium]|nr:helix-turn-helix transcriptional regulator [Lachnospiraceae bacterium]MBO5145216.1 helix-turn-helix transcriptional regulator [Lachnospiraceae bacterium]